MLTQVEIKVIYHAFTLNSGLKIVKFEVMGRNNGFLEFSLFIYSFIHSFIHSKDIRSFSQKFKLVQPSDSGNRVFFINIIYFWTKY